jgi:hypothetical protein
MFSNLLDSDTQDKINETLGSTLFPFKCYLIILLFLLIFISYILYQLQFKLDKSI